MGDNSIQLLIAAFQDEGGADAALKLLKEAKKENLINIKDAAVLRKDASGKLHISEVNDMTGTKGAGVGVVVGAALGILTGGATLAIAGVGAIAGGLAAKLRDSGFKDERLKKLGESLKPGSSAIVALTGDKSLAAEAQKEFRKAGAADVLIEEISADVANQLEAGREVAYSAAASEKGVAMGRAVTGDDLVAVSGVAATEDGIVAGSVVATADGVAAERLTATGDSVTYEAAAVVVESDEEKQA
jgi:uncharacterized membrane protein